VKLLYDENLAPSLVEALADIFPESLHIREVGLKSAPDPVVWAYAATAGYAIVSKDSDFRQRSFLYGHPPKVIWTGSEIVQREISQNSSAIALRRSRDSAKRTMTPFLDSADAEDVGKQKRSTPLYPPAL
jgi:predicted nuclease of predicted toxin-antitoxin system